MTDPHLVFTESRLNIPCSQCAFWTDQPHFVGERRYCNRCCTVCNPVGEWSEA